MLKITNHFLKITNKEMVKRHEQAAHRRINVIGQ